MVPVGSELLLLLLSEMTPVFRVIWIGLDFSGLGTQALVKSLLDNPLVLLLRIWILDIGFELGVLDQFCL